MKNVKFGLLALVSIVGIGGAFASKPHKFNGTTYYAISDGAGHFTWATSVNTDLYQCVTSNAYCTIVTNQTPNFTPSANTLPPDNKLSFKTNRLSAYQRIPL